MISTSTGELTVLDTVPTTIPAGHVVVQGTQEDIEQLSRTVSDAYRAQRRSKNKTAKQSRRANR